MARRFLLTISVTTLVFCSLFSGNPAEAATIYVDLANCPGPGDGSQGNPFCKIQTAIDVAVNGDTILVADGVYTGTGNKNLDFGGKLITLQSVSDDAATCVIDCQGFGRGFYFHSSETVAATVAGFTIRNGRASSSSPGGANGGGVYFSSSSPTLTNCRISGNTATASATPSPCGGGVYCTSASPSLYGCTISDNTVSASATSVGAAGGGVYCTGYSSTPTLTSCLISGNTAFSLAASSIGGAVYCGSSARPSVVNCTISGNASLSYSSYSNGGAVYCSSSSPKFTNCTIFGNTAACNAYPSGGALYCNTSATPALTNCILWGDAPNEVSVASGTPGITYCDIQGGYTGAGNTNIDPAFAFPDDLHLMPSSACIDAGTNSPVGGLPAQDADGNPRSLDGNGDGQARADMGAYEFNPAAPAIALGLTRVEFTVPQGQIGTDPRTLPIRNAGGGTLSWSLSWDSAWLQAGPAQGESTGEVDMVALLADATALPLGTYSTWLNVAGLQASNSPRAVEVVLYVVRVLSVPDEYATIQAAINAASTRDEVAVADGVYTGAGNKDLDFQGKNLTVRSASGDPAACIIDCEDSGRGFYFHTGETAVARVDGLTIRNGAVSVGSPGGARGGGIYCSGSSPTLTNCTIDSCTAAASGNPSQAYGGGVSCDSYSSPTLTNCTISGNKATSSGPGSVPYGGGFSCLNFGRPMLVNCTISSNLASSANTSSRGGGVYTDSSCGPVFTNCAISQNTATFWASGTGSGADGGGVYCASSIAALCNCTINENAAVSSATLPNGWPMDNVQGGGISCVDSSPKITNCVVRGNTAGGGGGIHCYNQGNPKLTNCTITGNRAFKGGGLYCQSSGPTLTNCIFWGDMPQEIAEVGSFGFTVTYCNIQDGHAGTGNISVDPRFAFDDDVHLMPGSPCIDAGTNSPSGGLPIQDADGNSRAIDGNGDGEALADIGAYEVNPAVPTMAISPTRIVLFAAAGQVGERAQTLSIRNAGVGTLHWSLRSGASWLLADPVQGESTGETDTATLTADADSLSLGVYTTRMTVSDSAASNTPRIVEVVLHVIRTLHVPGEYATIQAAIDAAMPYDEVVIADGAYQGAGNKNLDFNGKNITVRSASGNPTACIIDCQNSGRGFYFHTNETTEAVLEGLTIRNGNVLDNSPGGAGGGGVLCFGASPTLSHCAISGNAASPAGTVARGGGVLTEYGSPVIRECTITGNTAVFNVSSYGDGGGGVFCNGASPTLIGCTIAGNTASAPSSTVCAGGGLLADQYSNPTLIECAIQRNIASYSGGGIFFNLSYGVLLDCSLKDNAAVSSGGGGALFGGSSAAVLRNCVISGNTASSDGGGVSSGSAPVRLINCTITGNNGGGVDGSSSYLTLSNCILWGDMPQEVFGNPVVTYSDVQGGYAGTGNINLTPGFAFDGEFHLTSGSPCIDRGTNTPAGGLPTRDADGNPRALDGNGDGDSRADMGAYEFNPARPAIAVSPAQIMFFIPEGQPGQTPQILSIRNVGGGTLSWTLDWNASWLQANPLQGESTGEVDPVTLTADASTLPHGIYSTELHVADCAASNSPQFVEVFLYATRTLYVPGEYATIQAAIDASVPGDEILVADGTYSGTGNKNLDYHGKPITVRSASGNPAVCIIDCQGNGRGFYFHSRETAAAVVDGFTIRNGHVTDSSAGQVCGGGVYCTSSSPTLTNCAIIANTASSPHSLVYGGGVYCCFSSATLTDCTISGNDASSGDYVAYGGGVYCSFSSNPILTNCRISGNRASAPAYVAYGGGVYCGDSSNPSVTNCTITGNKALAVSGSAFGGGVACDWDSSPTLTSCILWGDTPQETYVASGTPVVTYCDIQGSYAGVGNINLNPLFFDPDGPDNNPNTWQDNDYRLSPGSPCIDAGKNSAVPAGVTTDLDGHPRFADDPASPDCRYAPGTCGTPPIVDMGAYELIPAPPIPGDLDGDYDVDGADFAVFLAAYGRCTGYPLYNAAADLNGDGCVTLVDYQQWLQAYRDFNGDPFAPPPQPSDLGDVNGDGAVNGIDVQAFVEVLLNPGEATLRERFVTDFNGDGESDAADVAGFVQVLVAK